MHQLKVVGIVWCLVLAGGCKKKTKTEGEPAAGSGSAAMGSAGSDTGSSAGSAVAGSAAEGSAGSAAAGSAGSAAAGSAAADTGTVEPAKTCSPKAWKEKTGLFCVDVPDFKAGKPEDYLDGDGVKIKFKRAAAGDKPELMFTVTWRKKTTDANAESIAMAGNMETDFKNNKGEEQGKFAGGKGRYVVFARKPEEKSHQLYAVVNGNKHAYNCEASSYDKPIEPELIAACKAVIATD
ncbi:MAG TPA: hypothetical protein VIV40_43580 [Kofleriaceae bacterium]